MSTPQKQTEFDWVRLAAFIDGEGSILIVKGRKPTIRKPTPPLNVRVAVFNTDPRLIVWCKKTFGMGHIGIRKRINPENHRVAYTWTVDQRQAEYIITGCLPFFLLKREQADIALACRATMGHWGTRKLPKEVQEYRLSLKNKLIELRHVSLPLEKIS